LIGKIVKESIKCWIDKSSGTHCQFIGSFAKSDIYPGSLYTHIMAIQSIQNSNPKLRR